MAKGKTEAAAQPETKSEEPKLVGTIVEANPLPPVAPFHAPGAAELSAFPPPAPIGAPVFPQAAPGTVYGDRMMMSGLPTGHLVAAPVIDVTEPPPPPPPPKFDELSKKTRNELKAAYVLKHGSDEGFHFVDRTQDYVPRSNIVAAPVPEDAEPAVDMSKLSEKTRREMNMGSNRLARRSADYRDVLNQVASNDAKKLADGAPVNTDSMGYPAG
jgi:hypothetical protein